MQKVTGSKIRQLGWLNSNQKVNIKHLECANDITPNLFSNLLLQLSENQILRNNFNHRENSKSNNLHQVFWNAIGKQEKVNKVQIDTIHSLFTNKTIPISKSNNTNVVSSREFKSELNLNIEPELHINRKSFGNSIKEIDNQVLIEINPSIVFKKEHDFQDVEQSEIAKHFPLSKKIANVSLVDKLGEGNFEPTQKFSSKISDSISESEFETILPNLKEEEKNIFAKSKGHKNEKVGDAYSLLYPKTENSTSLRGNKNFLQENKGTDNVIVHGKEKLEKIELKLDTSKQFHNVTTSENNQTYGKISDTSRQSFVESVDMPSKVATMVENSKEFPIKAEIHLQPKWLGKADETIEQPKKANDVKSIGTTNRNYQGDSQEMKLFNSSSETKEVVNNHQTKRIDGMMEQTKGTGKDDAIGESKEIKIFQGNGKISKKETIAIDSEKSRGTSSEIKERLDIKTFRDENNEIRQSKSDEGAPARFKEETKNGKKWEKDSQEFKGEQGKVENWTRWSEGERKYEVKVNGGEQQVESQRGQQVGDIKRLEENSVGMSKQVFVRAVDMPSKVATMVENSKEFPIKAEIHLQPKWLGMVIVEINVVNDKVEVVFKSENKETLQILENQAGFLKEKLQNLGFERQSISFQSLIEDKENSFGTFSNKQGKQEEEELKRKFLQSFLKFRGSNENYVLNKWGEYDYQH